MLAWEPLVILTSPSIALPLGAASAVGPTLHDRGVDFVVNPSWAWELPGDHQRLTAAARAHLILHPRHRFWFACNNDTQTAILTQDGWQAATLNSNMLIDERVFRPLPDVEPDVDAVYNARFVREKCHHLARELNSLLLITFRDHSAQPTAEAFYATRRQMAELLPKAEFCNDITPEGCRWLPPDEVNTQLNRARIGLCLSPIEGQMRGSMEYMMAGLSIVSIPSIGGRDYFFDPEYCLIAPDNPRDIRDAVAALIARNVPREYVRDKTMQRVARERERFTEWVQTIVEGGGGSERFGERLPQLLRGGDARPWRSMQRFAEEVVGR